jgi:microsomal dipeptidase-like Zn-dependent dipeptidase
VHAAVRIGVGDRLDLDQELLRRGRSGSDVRAVLGGNFLRVAEAVWG